MSIKEMELSGLGAVEYRRTPPSLLRLGPQLISWPFCGHEVMSTDWRSNTASDEETHERTGLARVPGRRGCG
jgi:hypothetical protein